MLQEPPHRCVAGLVVGDGGPLALAHHLGLLLQATHHPVHRRVEVLELHRVAHHARGVQRRLVAHVGDVRAREARRERGHRLRRRVGVDAELDLLEVGHEDLLAPADVGQVDQDLPVEAARAHQRVVEDVGAVGGGEDHDAARRVEAVHLDQQLVERVLPLVVGAGEPAAPALAAHRVDLVDEDDARRERARLRKEVTHAARADADKHLDEVGARDAEEGHRRFARRRLGQQRLAAAGRPVEEHALARLHPEELKLVAVHHRELHCLLELALDVRQAADVLPRDVGDLDGGLAQCRGVGQLERLLEVRVPHARLVEQSRIDRLLINVHPLVKLCDARHCRLEDDLRQVGGRVPLRVARNLLEIDVLGERHLLHALREDVHAPLCVGRGDGHLHVEPSEAAQRRVDRVGPVGRADHDHPVVGAELVHEREQLRDHPLLRLALCLVACGCDRIELVDEENGGRVLATLVEGLA
mmetsp:Transcript_39804/g.98394  ORF Transcript_39804/g.98394 Transcript_39804/m.98394 type:complete len:471 (-) Transcript_39804:1031-2443(-)